MTTIRDHAEMLSHLGHLGQRGRRPRILEGIITQVHRDGTADVSLHGAPPVERIKVDATYTPLILKGAHVHVEAVSTDLTIRGTRT